MNGSKTIPDSLSAAALVSVAGDLLLLLLLREAEEVERRGPTKPATMVVEQREEEVERDEEEVEVEVERLMGLIFFFFSKERICELFLFLILQGSSGVSLESSGRDAGQIAAEQQREDQRR